MNGRGHPRVLFRNKTRPLKVARPRVIMPKLWKSGMMSNIIGRAGQVPAKRYNTLTCPSTGKQLSKVYSFHSQVIQI